MLLSRSGLSRIWWEDAATHWVCGKFISPVLMVPLTPSNLVYNRKPDLYALRPFGCLAYVNLQKDQRPSCIGIAHRPVRSRCVPDGLQGPEVLGPG